MAAVGRVDPAQLRRDFGERGQADAVGPRSDVGLQLGVVAAECGERISQLIADVSSISYQLEPTCRVCSGSRRIEREALGWAAAER